MGENRPGLAKLIGGKDMKQKRVNISGFGGGYEWTVRIHSTQR